MRDIKERCCTALPEQGMSSEEEDSISYTLPSNQVLEIDHRTRTLPCEVLFSGRGDDSSIGGGVAHMIHKALEARHPDSRPALREHVLLSGGSTCLEGFDTRLLSELRALGNDSSKFTLSEAGLSQKQKTKKRIEKNW